jgi:hypothetical protein
MRRGAVYKCRVQCVQRGCFLGCQPACRRESACVHRNKTAPPQTVSKATMASPGRSQRLQVSARAASAQASRQTALLSSTGLPEVCALSRAAEHGLEQCAPRGAHGNERNSLACTESGSGLSLSHWVTESGSGLSLSHCVHSDASKHRPIE